MIIIKDNYKCYLEHADKGTFIQVIDVNEPDKVWCGHIDIGLINFINVSIIDISITKNSMNLNFSSGNNVHLSRTKYVCFYNCDMVFEFLKKLDDRIDELADNVNELMKRR